MSRQEQHQLFQRIIGQNKGILLKVSRAYCPNEDDRQDLLQEIMIQIWRSMDRYDERYKLSTWLYRISLNVAISFYRKDTRRVKNYTPLDNQPELSSEEAPSDNEWQLKHLEQFIGELKEIDKALILLYLEEKSHADIAEIMGISVSNVGTKIGRIKELLKKRFLNLNKD